MDQTKLEKLLGEDTLGELNAMDDTELKDRITTAAQSMRKAKTELKENDKFKSASEILKDLRGGLRDVNKRQNGIIEYALLILSSRGKLE
jgi:hypothetical protein